MQRLKPQKESGLNRFSHIFKALSESTQSFFMLDGWMEWVDLGCCAVCVTNDLLDWQFHSGPFKSPFSFANHRVTSHFHPIRGLGWTEMVLIYGMLADALGQGDSFISIPVEWPENQNATWLEKCHDPFNKCSFKRVWYTFSYHIHTHTT